MSDYLNVYDMNRRKSAVLQNAFDITETQELNKIYSLDFKIPADDPKVQYVQPFHYVRYGDNGELYRIIKTELEDSDTPILSVSCEHVIAVLVDDLMFGAYQYGGGTVKTTDVIRWLLSKQKTQNWELAECDFDRRFEYNWEQENILNALYSIPKEFSKAYKWQFNTTGYPWQLSLKAIDTTVHPEFYIRAKRNLLSSGTAQDFTDVCTRIYPLGYGEGVNQLGIKEINNNVPYLQSPAEVVAQYGIKEKVLVDRRFEDAESLKSYAQTMLDALQTPSMSRSFDVVDLYPLTSQDIDRAEVGKICKMTRDGTIAYITKTVRVLDEAGDLTIDLSTKAIDVASSIADLADRVRIESVYAQGATQLYQHSKDANATPSKGMVMSLYFPSEMRQINKVLMRLKLGKFRSYSQTTENNGGYDTTLSVSESSKTITSQTNTLNETVTVVSKSATVESQINTESETISIAESAATFTTDMTPDVMKDENGDAILDSEGNEQRWDLTTTEGGGGSATTSASTGDNTIDITSTTESKWDQSEYEPTTKTAYARDGDGNSINGKTINTGEGLLSWGESSNKGSGWQEDKGDGHHVHTTNVAYKHYHQLSNFTVSIPTLNIPINQFAHKHDINLSGVGSHNHTVTFDAHSHNINIKHQHKYTIPGWEKEIPCPKHTHSITVPSQTLSVPCPKHTHSITIPGWTKTISIPAHSHGINAGIFESGNPQRFDIYVGSTKKATINATSYNGDIVSWLLNNKNQVPRDTWIDVEIRPNDLAYCQCSVFVQGFVQSRGGGNY